MIFGKINRNKELIIEIFKIALPAIGGFLGLILFDVIDIFWVEKLGTKTVAAVASAGFIISSFYSLMIIPSAGCTSLVAQFYGANKKEKCYEVIVEATLLSIIMAIITTIVVLPFINLPFELMGLDAEAVAIATRYFKYLLLGMPIIFLDQLFGNIFNAYGDNKISNIIMIICLLINGILDPILMFGWLGFSPLNVEGAAIATLIGHLVSLILRTYFLRKKAFISSYKSFFKYKFNYFREIIKIGFPNACSSWVWSMVYPVLTKQITGFGIIHVSAIGICHRLEDFPFFISQGFCIAATSLTGYYLGKNENEKIDKILDGCLFLSSMLITPFMMFFLYLPHNLIELLSTDYHLIIAGAEYLYIIGIFEIFMAYENLLTGLFTGLGKTLPTTLITMPLTLGRIPLAWLFATYYGYGINGIWWAISISTLLKGIGLLMLYKYYQIKTNNFKTLKSVAN